jgi:hypothetical protein
MLLACPISWPHSFVMAALPLALAWERLDSWAARRLYWVAFVVLWLPNYYFPMLSPPAGETATEYLLGQSVITPARNVALVSIPNYALLALFVLVLRTPAGSRPSRTRGNECEPRDLAASAAFALPTTVLGSKQPWRA